MNKYQTKCIISDLTVKEYLEMLKKEFDRI